MFDNLKQQLILNFIKDDRWKYLVNGLKITLTVAIAALVIGIALGTILAIIRSAYDLQKPRKDNFFGVIFSIANSLTKAYLTIVRGTPVVVQLMIMYYIIFASSTNKLLAAILCFGLNSAAYVAEIVRGGIMSVDIGQMEAGRSLGLSYTSVMKKVIIPQAIKNILPALGNEMIALIKETSVCGFIGLDDLTRGADIIRGVTYSAMMPLLAIALIYLTLVVLLTSFLERFERRLARIDRS